MFIRIRGKLMYLWRAVDAEGEVVDVLVQATRAAAAARKLMRKLLRKHGIAPTTWVTDKWPASGAARRDLRLDGIPHLQGKRLNNRAESLPSTDQSTKSAATRAMLPVSAMWKSLTLSPLMSPARVVTPPATAVRSWPATPV
jgi:transposase-like protein